MASTTGWDSSRETGAVGNDQSLNNSSGFNAFPQGSLSFGCNFRCEGDNAIFWSSTENNPDYAWYRTLDGNSSALLRNDFYTKHYGFSVRFVRD